MQAATPSQAPKKQPAQFTEKENPQSQGELTLSNDSKAYPESSQTLFPSELFGVSLVLIFGFWRGYVAIKKYRKPKGSKIASKSFNRVSIAEDNQLVFYRRHEAHSSEILPITSVTHFTVLINNERLNTMDNAKTVMNNDIEQQLRVALVQLHRQKIDKKEIRHIQLLIYKEEKVFPVTLYLRQGNHRLTQSSFKKIVEDLLSFCWLLSGLISKNSLEPRQYKEEFTDYKKSFSAQLTQKASIAVKNTQNALETPKKTTEINQKHQEDNDIEMINALDKLAHLQESGHITEQEFKLAKEKILADFIRS